MAPYKNMPICFLDLDGVLVNTNKGLERNLGISLHPWKKIGIYDICEAYPEISREDLNNTMSLDSFWAELEPYAHTGSFIKYLERLFMPDNIFLLTKPIDNSLCYKGKYEWVQKYLPQYKNQLFIGTSKYACANSRAVLIDDSDENITRFVEWGGHAICFPQPWNSLNEYTDVQLKYVKDELNMWLFG